MGDRIPEERQELYDAAAESWGDDAQLAKAAEEFAEGSAASARALNEQMPRDEFLKELADVRLMLEQMESLFFEREEVDQAVTEATADLRDRLERYGDGVE